MIAIQKYADETWTSFRRLQTYTNYMILMDPLFPFYVKERGSTNLFATPIALDYQNITKLKCQPLKLRIRYFESLNVRQI